VNIVCCTYMTVGHR